MTCAYIGYLMVMKTCNIGHVDMRLGNENLYIVDATNRILHY
jgi:hypothetical protein